MFDEAIRLTDINDGILVLLYEVKLNKHKHGNWTDKRLRWSISCYNMAQSQYVYDIFNLQAPAFCNGVVEMKKIEMEGSFIY